MTLLSEGLELGSYRLDRCVGSGAFSEVWLAYEEGSFGFRKRVALKVLKGHAATSDEQFEALVNEARVCGHLHHPHLVDVYGVYERRSVRFIAMQYVDGPSLDDLQNEAWVMDLPFPRSVIVDLGIHVAQALHHAHRARGVDGEPLRIVHRDLKPGNILMARRGGAKVADFGIAKATTSVTNTEAGVLKGTPCYVAPEVWQGSRDFKPSLDLFALGSILWELTMRRRLFTGEDIVAMAGQAVNGDPDAEAALLADVFPELAPVVRKLLERDPDLRTQSGREVELELKAVRRKIEAPAGLDLFGDLFHSASGGVLSHTEDPDDLTVPATDDPAWSELIERALNMPPPISLPRSAVAVLDTLDFQVDFPSPEQAPAAAASDPGALGFAQRVVSMPGQVVPVGALFSRPGALLPSEPELRLPADPPWGTQSVVSPTRATPTVSPWGRWPYLLIGGFVALAALGMLLIFLEGG